MCGCVGVQLVDGYGESLAVPLFRLSVQAEQNEVSVAAAKAYASILNKCTDGGWRQKVEIMRVDNL